MIIFKSPDFIKLIVLGPPFFVPLANNMAKEYFQLDWTKSNCFKIIFLSLRQEIEKCDFNFLDLSF